MSQPNTILLSSRFQGPASPHKRKALGNPFLYPSPAVFVVLNSKDAILTLIGHLTPSTWPWPGNNVDHALHEDPSHQGQSPPKLTHLHGTFLDCTDSTVQVHKRFTLRRSHYPSILLISTASWGLGSLGRPNKPLSGPILLMKFSTRRRRSAATYHSAWAYTILAPSVLRGHSL